MLIFDGLLSNSCPPLAGVNAPRVKPPGAIVSRGIVSALQAELALGLLVFASLVNPASSAPPKPQPPGSSTGTQMDSSKDSAPEDPADLYAVRGAPWHPPLSVFNEKSPNRRDPFFFGPGWPGKNSVESSSSASTASAGQASLRLEGVLTGAGSQQRALINNRWFHPGDTREIVIGGRKVAVRCQEIHERFVVIDLDGKPERRELYLGQDQIRP